MVKDVRSPRATGRRPMARVPARKRKKPLAARGKTTRKGKIKKVIKSILTGGAMIPMVSPKTKVKQMQNLMKKMKTASPGMKKAMTGSAKGAGSAGLLAMARKLKPAGRLNARDLERVKKMMGKQSGGAPGKIKAFKKPFDMPAGKKPVFDSQGNPVKNLFQKDDRLKRPKRNP